MELFKKMNKGKMTSISSRDEEESSSNEEKSLSIFHIDKSPQIEKLEIKRMQTSKEVE